MSVKASPLSPCPHGGCWATREHYHVIRRGVVNPQPVSIECSDAARGKPCKNVASPSYTTCHLPPLGEVATAPGVEPMFALSTVEALIRAAIADEREGLGPFPVEPRGGGDDDRRSDDDLAPFVPPVWDVEFLKRYYYTDEALGSDASERGGGAVVAITPKATLPPEAAQAAVNTALRQPDLATSGAFA